VRVEVCDDAPAAAAEHIAEVVRTRIATRGRCAVAVSGGHTPKRMLRALAGAALPWAQVDVFQVDERAAPAGSADRNATLLREAFAGVPVALHLMPVDDLTPEEAADRYEATLREVLGARPALDLVHLGLGREGHTASLLPGGPAGLDDARDVAAVAVHQGLRRVTLTRACLRRATARLWLVTGAGKREALSRLARGEGMAGSVAAPGDVVFTDAAAAGRA